MGLTENEEFDFYGEGSRFWTREALQQVVERILGHRLVIVVSNREPYVHRFDGDEIVCERPVSGLVTALEPVMRVCRGVWVAHGSGDADRDVVDTNDRIAVPPEHPEYSLRRVWLSKSDEREYYHGFANQALWPLCHIVYERPVFAAQDWDGYARVNRQFADIVLEEARGQDAVVLIQDYHFALLPSLLRQRNPNLLIAQFWHVPWPNRETFLICPWGPEIIEGLLGNDLLGFHTRYHCQNFLETVAATTEARVDDVTSTVTRAGRSTVVRPFPISVDLDSIRERSMSEAVTARLRRFRHQLGLTNHRVLLGVDRIDYTKGIPERLRALDRLLELHPEYLGKLRFVQIGSPSRTRIRRYQELARDIRTLVEEINWKHAQERWVPIIYLPSPHTADDLLCLYRLADVCVTTPLHDGMNLVAKEYAAARADGDGVLVLSRFAGAARELEQSLRVNPYAIDETAMVLHEALSMDEAERRARMAALRETVARNNIYRWAGKLVTQLGQITGRRSLETVHDASVAAAG